MTKRSTFPGLLSLLLLATALVGSAADSVETVIALARTRLGGDAALDAVQSIHYTGTIEAVIDSPGGAKPEKAAIDIIFQKPLKHRLTITGATGVDVTTLDDYTGWRQTRMGGDKPRVGLAAMSRQDVRRLRADITEGLFFFRGIEQRGGEIVDLGEAGVGAIACRKIAFRHGSGVEFIRYFDAATGRLVLTETGPANTIREEGEVVVDGVHFPRRIVQTNKTADGPERVYTITLDTIVLNETFPPDTFERPIVVPGK